MTDFLLWSFQASFFASIYIVVSLLGVVILERLAKILRVRNANLGLVASVALMPLLFPTMIVWFLIVTVANAFKRRNNGL